MSKIKIVHTSDWHLGKKLFRNERLPEQKLFLNWLHDYLDKNKIDILLVAGDIFDIPNPPNNAQQLYFDWIYNVSKLEHLHIIIIGGNHDSSSLLNIPKRFFKDKRCYVFTGLAEKEFQNDCILEIRGQKIGIKTLPYFRNFELINQIDKDKSIEDFFSSYFSNWNEDVDTKILCSHHSFGHSAGSGSEHSIYLSGVESFPLSWIKNQFDYCALGHIHKKIELSQNPPIIYPGSPIPMRFSETNTKYISHIDIENNNLSYKLTPIPIFRSIISLETTVENMDDDLDAIITKLDPNELNSYLEVKLRLSSPESGLADKIRDKIKDKNIELISYVPKFAFDEDEQEKPKVMSKNIFEIFDDFYKLKFGSDETPSDIKESFRSLIEEVQNEDS